MRIRTLLVAAIVAVAACDVIAQDWPDRRNRSPEQMLVDLVQWHQRRAVRMSTGTLAHQCFTDDDYKRFVAGQIPLRIVTRLKGADDFAAIVAALRTFPREKLVTELRSARRHARPTWAQIGFIDPQGRGQTEAGHAAELQIAAAIVDAFAAELDVDLAAVR
jgi:hypothetical protein